ncbi:MAG: relaxase/mobilization nuclease domain-containing protein [Pantoea sp.]|uniref:relaxase/mobilization nuclease domain-containing protein n=1 Tax=Pantoea sp. TaxID=69393 RepID=UPI0039E256F8
MKGMDRIRRGKSFGGVVAYALKPAPHHLQVPFVIGGNMPGTTVDELAVEFSKTSQLRPDVVKAVWHNSLRLPSGESLSTQKWSEIADSYMKRMGFSSTHLRTYIFHDDMAGQHIHIIASRIDMADGNLYLGRNENLISTRIIQELERDYSLTRTKGPTPLEPSAPAKPKKISRNEQQMEERQGKRSPKSVLQSALEGILSTKPTTQEFVQQLVAQNIKVVPNIASTGRMNGFSFEYDGIPFKASQLGKGYSWSALQDRIDYQPERDKPYLFALKNPVVAETIEYWSVDLVHEDELPNLTVAEAQAVAETNSQDEPLETVASDPSTTAVPIDINHIQIQDGGAETEPVTGKRKANHYQGHLKLRWLSWIPYLDTFRGLLKGLGYNLLRATTANKPIAKVQPLHEDIVPEQAPKGIKHL